MHVNLPKIKIRAKHMFRENLKLRRRLTAYNHMHSFCALLLLSVAAAPAYRDLGASSILNLVVCG